MTVDRPAGGSARHSSDVRDSVATRSKERYRRAALTSVTAIMARGVALATTVVTVPLTLPYLGAERYGLWATISSLTALMIAADLGIGNGLMTAIARERGLGDTSAVRRYSATGVGLLILVGAGILGVFLLVYPLISWSSVLNVDGAIARSEAGLGVMAFAVCFSISIPLLGIAQVRFGMQEAYTNNLFGVGGSLAALGLVLLATASHAGVPALVVAFMSGPLIASGANAIALYRRTPGLLPRRASLDLRAARSLISSGAQFLVLQLAMGAAFYSATVIAATVLGPIAAAEIAVTGTLFALPAGLVNAALTPLWPAYADSVAHEDTGWIKSTLQRSLWMAVLVSVPLVTLFVVLSPAALSLLTGGLVDPPALLVVLFAAWTVLRAVGTALAMFLNGLHLLRVQVLTAVLMGTLSVGLGVLLASRIGVSGIVLGAALAYVMATLIPVWVYVRRVVRRMDS